MGLQKTGVESLWITKGSVRGVAESHSVTLPAMYVECKWEDPGTRTIAQTHMETIHVRNKGFSY